MWALEKIAHVARSNVRWPYDIDYIAIERFALFTRRWEWLLERGTPKSVRRDAGAESFKESCEDFQARACTACSRTRGGGVG